MTDSAFTLTMSAAQIQSLRDLIEKAGEEWGVVSGDAEILAALDAAKPVRRRAAAKPASAPAEPYEPRSGDERVDAFMRAHHDPKYKPLPLPKSPGLPPLRAMKVSEQDAAERDWKRECERAAEAVAAGGRSDAEETLQTLIAIHRTPWRRRGDAYVSSEHGFTIARGTRQTRALFGGMTTDAPVWIVSDESGRPVGEPVFAWEDAERLIDEARRAIA